MTYGRGTDKHTPAAVCEGDRTEDYELLTLALFLSGWLGGEIAPDVQTPELHSEDLEP